MPVLEINGVSTAVETRGDAARPALLLLHGGVTGNIGHHYWELHNIADRLAEDFFVVTYDRRGHGETPFIGTFDDVALDVIGVMDTLGLKEASVLGLSAGSYVSGRAAILAPERFTSLIFTAAHSHLEGKTPLYQWAERNHVDLTQFDPRKVEGAMYSPATSERTKRPYRKLASKYAKCPYPGEEDTRRAYEVMGRFDNREGFKTLTIPTLIVAGLDDQLFPIEVQREVHALIRGSQMVELPDTGHNIWEERPEEALSAVRQFLLSVLQSEH